MPLVCFSGSLKKSAGTIKWELTPWKCSLGIFPVSLLIETVARLRNEKQYIDLLNYEKIWDFKQLVIRGGGVLRPESKSRKVGPGFATDENTDTDYRPKWAPVSVFRVPKYLPVKPWNYGCIPEYRLKHRYPWEQIPGYLPKLPSFEPHIPRYLPDYRWFDR